MDFMEFIRLMAKKFVEEDLNSDIREAFRIFDKDGSGTISAGEFKSIMMNLGERLTEEEAEEMLMEADINGDGTIDYEGGRGLSKCIINKHVINYASQINDNVIINQNSRR